MTAPTPPVPDAWDPTDRLRDIYRTAETALLRTLSAAVAATIDDPTQQTTIELQLQRDTRRIVNLLNTAAMAEIDTILAMAPLQGETRANLDDL